MKPPVTKLVKGTFCPHCGAKFDEGILKSSSINNVPTEIQPGHFGICAACGEFISFDQELRPVKLSHDQKMVMLLDRTGQAAALLELQERIKGSRNRKN